MARRTFFPLISALTRTSWSDFTSSAGTSSLLSRGMVTVKVEPSPSTLLTSIVPPSKCASFLVMESPRPVPPYLRVLEPSTCRNSSKMYCRAWEGIPIPVSETAILSRESSNTAESFTSPSSVNLSALLRRLMIICFNLS